MSVTRCPCGYQAASPEGLRWHLTNLGVCQFQFASAANPERVSLADLGEEPPARSAPPPPWLTLTWYVFGDWETAAALERDCREGFRYVRIRA